MRRRRVFDDGRPNVFWSLGFDPYADLTEASNFATACGLEWIGRAGLPCDGRELNNAKFRYAQAYGAFLANAHLWRADFQGAFMSEADLRGADLAIQLEFAVLDRAQMNHANLDRPNLEGANLRARGFARRESFIFSLAGRDAGGCAARWGEPLHGAADFATMTRANLEKADLRESYLDGAHMDHADMRSGISVVGADCPGRTWRSANWRRRS